MTCETNNVPGSAAHDIDQLLGEWHIAQRYSDDLVSVLDDDQVLWRPHDDSSAIGWHLGHQAAVAHYLVRNLTAAEPSFDPVLDRLFDSATPERARGALPEFATIGRFRSDVTTAVDATIRRIAGGGVGAPEQLRVIALGVLRAITNHEYQHAQWIREVRDTMVAVPAPQPSSRRLVTIEGYFVVAA